MSSKFFPDVNSTASLINYHLLTEVGALKFSFKSNGGGDVPMMKNFASELICLQPSPLRRGLREVLSDEVSHDGVEGEGVYSPVSGGNNGYW